MKCYFSDIAFVYQTSDIRRGKSNRSRPWLTTHRNRLRGVDSEESEWGTSTAFPLQDFHRPTEDVSLDFHRCGIYFRSLARPTRKILFFTPELGSLNVIWRCRISGAVFGEVGVGGVVVVSPPPLLRYLWVGWQAARRNHLALSSFVLCSLSVLLSPLFPVS